MRFDLERREEDRSLARLRRQGRHRRVAQERRADAVVSADKALFDGSRRGETNAMAAMLREEVDVEGDVRLLVAFQRLLPGARALAGGAPRRLPRGGRDEQRARPDPGRQHLRRQQRERRHRGVVDRPDRPLLVRHALSLAVGADRERAAAEPAVGRRSPVLRDALLPRTGNGNRVHRREALGDPATRRRQRLPRGADDPQPRREARRPRRSHRCGLRLRRPVRGQGRAREEGEVLRARRVRPPAAWLPAGAIHARDADLGIGSGPARQERTHLQGSHRAPRRLVDGPGRRHRDRGRRHLRAAEVRARSEVGPGRAWS